MKLLRYIFILLLSLTLVTPATYAASSSQKAKTEQAKKAAAKKKTAKQKAAQKKKDQRAKKKQQKANQRAKEQEKKKSSSTTTMTAKQLKAYNARRFDIHNIAFWGGAGYSAVLHDGASGVTAANYSGDFSAKLAGGGGGLIGFGYEYNYKHFLLSVGPEFRIFSSTDKLGFTDPYSQPLPEYNQRKDYTFTKLNDTELLGQVMLPVMFGGSWDKVYFKAGAKVGYTLLKNNNQKGLVTTTIFDPDAYDPAWMNIPGHGAETDVPYAQKGTNPFGFDVALSAEVGLNLDKMLNQDWMNDNEDRVHPWRMRIALFADYGLPVMGPGFGKSVSQADVPFATTSNEAITTKPWLQTQWGANSLNSLVVGVKFTAMLQMNKVREEKKQDAYMAVLTYNTKTDRALAGIPVTIEGDGMKTISKTTNKKGLYAKRFRPGTYTISASAKGYIPVEDMLFTHEEVNDTAYVGLRPVPVYKYVVRDAKTGKAIAAQVTFLNAADEEVFLTATTDSLRETNTASLQLDNTYRVHIEAPDYFAYSGAIADIEGNDIFTLEPIIKKRKIILHDLYFATNSTVILPQSEAGLQDLYDLLNENPEVRIRITGHTDSVGSDKDNQVLSEGRANSVRDDMIRRGIDESRIEAEGKGESEPIDTNDTEEGRANNRRVEFVIL